MGDIKKHTVIDTGECEVINKTTGEVMQFAKNQKLLLQEETQIRTFDSKLYVYLDTQRLQYLTEVKGVKSHLIGLMLELSCYLSSRTNSLIREDKTPHSADTLAELLGQERQTVKYNLNKLVKLNLAELIKPSKRGEQRMYVLNPYVVKRGKQFSKSLGFIFKDPLPKAIEKDWSKEPNLK